MLLTMRPWAGRRRYPRRTRSRRLTLVHGDFSPKNVLVYRGRLVLLDHEVIHWGDAIVVVADTFWHAKKAADACDITWADLVPRGAPDGTVQIGDVVALLRMSVGLDFGSATPVRGVRTGGGEETMTVEVHVSRVD